MSHWVTYVNAESVNSTGKLRLYAIFELRIQILITAFLIITFGIVIIIFNLKL